MTMQFTTDRRTALASIAAGFYGFGSGGNGARTGRCAARADRRNELARRRAAAISKLCR
jgi:hypothetical protein